jgi:hypothetical protein
MTTTKPATNDGGSQSKGSLDQPNIQVLQAFLNLRVSDDFEAILEWLRLCRKTARDELEQHVDSEKFSRVQGLSLALKKFLDVADKAAPLLEQRQTRMIQNEHRSRKPAS